MKHIDVDSAAVFLEGLIIGLVNDFTVAVENCILYADTDASNIDTAFYYFG